MRAKQGDRALRCTTPPYSSTVLEENVILRSLNPPRNYRPLPRKYCQEVSYPNYAQPPPTQDGGNKNVYWGVETGPHCR